jgi:general stress protein YciG
LIAKEEDLMANQNHTGGNTSNRGFASMDGEKQRRIAQKGGEAVSRDREHMSAIGRKGGEASHGGHHGGGSTLGSQLGGGNRGDDQGGRNS